MARLGELLVAARLLDQEQVERALRAQVLWGGRLGTNLIELGFLDLDGISRALGRKHGLPAALARHFEKADRELQDRLDADLARQWSVVPLLHVGPEKKIAVAVLDPLPRAALAELADAMLCSPKSIVMSVAAEMRVRYHLERVYNIGRPTRYLRSKGGSVTPFPQFDNVPVPIDSDAEVAVPIAVDDTAHPTGRAEIEAEVESEILVEIEPPDETPAPAPLADEDVDDIERLIDEAIAQATAVEPTVPVGRDRRTYVRTLGDAGPVAPPTALPVGRVAIKRVPLAPAAETKPSAASFLEATRAIRRASNRDRIADLVVDALQRFVPVCDAALLLFVRGDVAISWKSFSRMCSTTGDIAVPLDQPGLVPTVIARNLIARASVADLGAIDEALMRSIADLRGDLVVVPVSIADNVMCVIAAVTERDAPVEGIESVAAAAGAAFARLIRDASR